MVVRAFGCALGCVLAASFLTGCVYSHERAVVVEEHRLYDGPPRRAVVVEERHYAPPPRVIVEERRYVPGPTVIIGGPGHFHGHHHYRRHWH